jgi:KDO2-lipid IV(A) lauroyltransferase
MAAALQLGSSLPMTGLKVARVRHAAAEVFLRAMVDFAGIAPRASVFVAFGGIGRLGYHLLARDRRRILAHLAQGMPGLDVRGRRRLARRVFVELGRNAADVFRFRRRPASELVQLIDVVGEEHFAAARAEGRGVVAVTGHLGAWELIPAYFVQQGIPVVVLARPLKYPRLEALLSGLRSRLGVSVVHEGASLRPALRALRSGGALGMVIDQDRRIAAGVWVPFLGRPSWTPTAPAELARRTGAALLPVGIRRVGKRHRITVLPAIQVDWQRPGATAAATAGLRRSIESLLWQCPEQWTWMYNPWSEGELWPEAGGSRQ